MRHFRVSITFPELPSAHAQYSYPVEAPHLVVAVRKAMAKVRGEVALRRKHLHQVHVHARVHVELPTSPAHEPAGA